MLAWRLLCEEKGCPAASWPTPAYKNKQSSQLCLSLPHGKAPLGVEKLSFAFTPEKFRSSFALRLPRRARQAPTEVELQVKALSGSHSPSTDFSQRD